MITKGQAYVLLHLLMFVTPQGRESFCSRPEFIAQRRCCELPLGALFSDRGRCFEGKQRDRLVDAAFAQIDATE